MHIVELRMIYKIDAIWVYSKNTYSFSKEQKIQRSV